jgi:NAD(P)-dependent dehydrogenase (short-subunit alcohol dehydrogenase family)
MTSDYVESLFGLQGKVAVVTGATGVLGGAMARGLARAGVCVGILGRRRERAEDVVREIERAGSQAMALPADVLDRGQLEAARDAIVGRWDRIDILVNAAGGNIPEAIVGDQDSFFDLPIDAFERVVDLNLLGTVLPSQVFGAVIARRGDGSIINISSMAVPSATTRNVGYSAGKAGAENFTRWLAIELVRKHGPGLRVNAIAPGFFVGEQNRDILLHPDGSPTKRGQTIIDLTPAGRFGEPDELIGTLIWLCSPGSRFVNGVTVPVDGGFSAFSGV